MSEKESKPVRVSSEVKVSLDILRGKRSYNSLISSMVNYFLTTKISPESFQVHPITQSNEQFKKIENRINASIEILRSIEKQTLLPMYELMRLSFNPSESKNENTRIETGVSLEEISQIVKINEEQSDTIKRKNTELKELREQLDRKQFQEKPIDKETIKQAISEIRRNLSSVQFESDQVKISKTTLEAYLDRILSVL